MLIALALAGADALHAQAGYQWTLAVPVGQHTPPAEWQDGFWPTGITPVPGPEGTLWMIDGSGVWSSPDAVTWSRVTDRVPFGGRAGVAAAFFDGKFWAVGGRSRDAPLQDVWFSTDGTTWRLATDGPRWLPRSHATLLVFKNQLWLLGGAGSHDLSDVWYSNNGINWYAATGVAGWAPGPNPAAVVHGERMVVAGGSGEGGRATRNDVWVSEDGKTWNRLMSRADWPSRAAHGFASYHGRLWVIGGTRGRNRWLNDVWSSEDGVEWRSEAEPPWAPRAVDHVAVFDGRLWTFGGRVGAVEERGARVGEIWFLDPVAP